MSENDDKPKHPNKKQLEQRVAEQAETIARLEREIEALKAALAARPELDIEAAVRRALETFEPLPMPGDGGSGGTVDGEIITKVDGLESSLSDVNTKVDGLESSITQIDTKVATLDGSITQIDTKVATLDSSLTQVNSGITTVGGQIATLSEDLGSKTAALETNISGEIASTTATLRTNIGGDIDGKNQTLRTNIGGDIDGKNQTLRTNIAGDIDGKNQTLRTDIAGDIDGKNQTLRSDLSAEFETQASLLDTSLGGKIEELGKPLPVLDLNTRGPEVAALHEALTSLGFSVPSLDTRREAFGLGTRDAVLTLQARYGVAETGVLDRTTREVLTRALAALEQLWRVEGRVMLDNGSPAQGLRLRLYAREVGGQRQLLRADATDDAGYFSLDYAALSGGHHVELCALGPDETELALAPPRAAIRYLRMSPVAPSWVQGLDSEYDRLFFEVGDTALAKAGVDDLALLHERSGWDARLLALAVLAVRLAGATGLSSEACYGLLRAGLPAEADALVFLSTAELRAALERSRAAQIVTVDLDLGVVEAAFASFVSARRGQIPLPGGTSTLAEMLAQSPLSPADRETFERLYGDASIGLAQLWSRAEAALGAEAVAILRWQGQLAFLTGNNHRLVAKLCEVAVVDGSFDIRRLIDAGYYEPGPWDAALTEIAGGDAEALAAMIPSTLSGGTTSERYAAYLRSLARRLREPFQTRVVAQRLANGELTLPDEVVTAAVVERLRAIERQGYELGNVAPTAYLVDDDAAVVEQITRLHRLFQIAPGPRALAVLLRMPIDSARDLLALDLDTFMRRHAASFPSPREAQLVYRKAEQVASVCQAVVTNAARVVAAPAVRGLTSAASQPLVARSLARTADAPALRSASLVFPTIEAMFGDLDYPECEHCRSVLAPAAYFVDLLGMLDPPALVWDGFCAEWLERHGVAYAPTHARPYDELTRRRPDLPQLGLSCENTHTELPYIDVVNEILEYRLANGGLDANMPVGVGASSAELIAVPQQDGSQAYLAAYTTLRTQRWYPLALPFDLFTETSRALLQRLGISRAELLALVRGPDEEPALVERLGLVPAQHQLLTDTGAAAGLHGAWYRLYGYAQEAEALAALTVDGLDDDKVLTRRLDIGYAELDEARASRFVGVAGEVTARLLRLNLFVRLQRWLDWPSAQLDAALLAFVPDDAASVGEGLGRATPKLARLCELELRLPDPPDDRRLLVALWTELRVDATLYAELFTSPLVAAADREVFASLPAAAKLVDHQAAVQGALGLGAAAIEAILGDARETAPLTCATLSLLLRHAVLARAMKLEVPALVAALDAHGRDAFASPAATLQFEVELRALRAAGLDAAALPSRPLAELDELELGPELRACLEHHAEVLAGFDPTEPLTSASLIWISELLALAGELGLDDAVLVAALESTAAAAQALDLAELRRTHQLLLVATRCGVEPGVLARWGSADTDAALVAEIESALRARHAGGRWLRVAQAIHDPLRQRRRDALVAEAVHALAHIDTREQLFEELLIDPGMEPIVTTSRLRLALSSVQLFVQRCLLNLEPAVPAAAIDGKRWAWMRRYRVWEANRNIFLHPENWLAPELRDQKSALFGELEQRLAESDLDEEVAELAFARYLEGLERISRLEVVSTYLEQTPLDPEARQLHVLARSCGQPHRYFMRHVAYGSWTPWTAVTTEIDGEHPTLVRWRGRAHVLWLGFVDRWRSRSPAASFRELADTRIDALERQRSVELSLRWTEHRNGAWTPALAHRFAELVEVADDFEPGAISVVVEKGYDDRGRERELRVVLAGLGRTLVMRGRTSTPQMQLHAEPRAPSSPYGDAFTVSFVRSRVTTLKPDGRTEVQVTRAGGPILSTPGAHRLVMPANVESWDQDHERLRAPLFFLDATYTFYVEPRVLEKTVDSIREYTVQTWVPDTASQTTQEPVAQTAGGTNHDWATSKDASVTIEGSRVGASGVMIEVMQ